MVLKLNINKRKKIREVKWLGYYNFIKIQRLWKWVLLKGC